MTDLMKKLDRDMERLFGPVAIPPIPAPLDPAKMAEGDQTSERG